MDLKNVRKMLTFKEFKFVEDFLNHVQLIWENCKLYNTEPKSVKNNYLVGQILTIQINKNIKILNLNCLHLNL